MADPKTPFDFAFEYTLSNEGGWANVHGDAGGLTKYGITQSTYSRYLGRPASALEIRNLDLETAKAIYHRYYWLTLGLDGLVHTGTAVAMFDIGVVRGISVPPKYAQSICDAHGFVLAQDGHIGPLTLSAMNQIPNAVFVEDLGKMMSQGFRAIVEKNPSQAKFAKGWEARAQRIYSLSVMKDVEMVGILPAETLIDQATVKPVETPVVVVASSAPVLKPVETLPAVAVTRPVQLPLPQLTLGERLYKAWRILMGA